MRCTQIIGISPEAWEFLKENVAMIPCAPCPHCGEPTSEKMDCYSYEDASYLGMFDDGPLLEEYTLKDGSKVREVEQATPWSSGPCIFLCLENEKGERMFEWPQEEIDNC